MNTTATGLYNTAHPLAESGKPIFIPFGEWPYDKTTRQRLDREHGEAIANELNERVARGEPGIPVYQGHPDVPALAAKYPDKGALGWVTKIALANEGGKDGLALTVEWDRDPGKGFKWFSPYWFANEKDRDGQTYIVANIRSIGLVNNPNIREFRLANEAAASSAADVRPTYKMPQHIIDLAKHFDDRVALVNVIDANGMGHSDENGQFDGSGSGGGGSGGSGGSATKPSVAEKFRAAAKKAAKDPAAIRFNDALKTARKNKDGAGIARAHMAALKAGMVWDKSIKGYRPPVGSDGGGASIKKQADAMKGAADKNIRTIAAGGSRKDTLDVVNGELDAGRWYVKNGGRDSDRADGISRRKAAHHLAILSGFKFNRGTGKYE